MKKIQVLGPGCPKCKRLAEHAQEAANDLGLACEIEKVTDLKQITSFGVMMTPALVVDGAVKVVGRVPSVDEVKKLIS
jgi:small redox-active disulfide protein 2